MGRKLAVTAALLALVAGCGGSAGAPGSLQASPTSTPTAPATPPAGATKDRLHPPGLSAQLRAQVHPLTTPPPVHDSTTGLTSVPWQLAAVQSGGQTLVITYSGGGCNTPAGARVTQSSTYVMIAAFTLRPRPTDKRMVCPAYAVIVVGSVRLNSPLGGRVLYHAPVSR